MIDANLSNRFAYVVRVAPIEIAAPERRSVLEPGAGGTPNQRSMTVSRRAAGR